MRRLLQWLLQLRQRLRLVATVIDESGGEDAAGVACDHVDGLPLRARACCFVKQKDGSNRSLQIFCGLWTS